MAVAKWNPKELTLGKDQGTVIKCLKSLPADTSWNNFKVCFEAVIFSGSGPMVTHAATQFIHTYQQKRESLQGF